MTYRYEKEEENNSSEKQHNLSRSVSLQEPNNHLSSQPFPETPTTNVFSKPPLPNMTKQQKRPSQTRGLVRVTHLFHSGERKVASVNRDAVGAVDDRPRRSGLTVVWDEAPRLVLLAANPDSKPAAAALPVLLAYLQRQASVVVAVDPAIAHRFDPDVAVVRARQSPHPGKGDTLDDGAPFLSEGMDNLSLTESAVDTVNTPADADVGFVKKRKEYAPEDVDLVMCLGGDGVILHVISHLFPRNVPAIMPFNLGSLGFLTPFDFANHEKDVAAILNGQNNRVTMRMRLKCVIVRQPVGPNLTRSPFVHNFDNNAISDEVLECSVREEFHVLNELVIDRGPAPYLSNLEVLCDDCPVTRVQADGIIVATPTGSTAYSLSSGGSMVHPNVPAILFTPICPHSLSFRPVLFPDFVTLQIKVPKDSRASAWVSFDGRHRMELMKGDKVVVSVSPWCVPTFSKIDTTNDWFASVSQCLRWNERVVQGSL